MEKAIVGVDVGGTNTVIGIFNESLSLVLKNNIPTLKPDFPNKTDNPKLFMDTLASEITRLVKEAGFDDRIASVGMGVPGKVNPIDGVAMRASNLGWVNVPMVKEMSDRLRVPVRIDNDVRIYTYGEAMAGAAKGYKNIVGLTLGTGLAASLIIEGKMLRGSDWYAGEIGHDTVKGNSAPCNCGKIGCLETIASATGIARLAREAVEAGKDTSLRNVNHTINSYDVYEACANGDDVAKQVFEQVGTVLGEKLATVVFLINPEIIVIGGGAAAAGDYLFDPIRSVLKEQYLQDPPVIRKGELGDSAGLIGAAHFALGHEALK